MGEPADRATAHERIVREIFERWADGDFAAGPDRYDPRVMLVLRPGFPESGTYIGVEEIRRYMRDDFLADLEGAAIAAEELIAAGDTVLVRVLQSATGPGSGAPVSMTYYQAWTFRGDRVIRIECIRERDEALSEVGLAE